MKKLVLKSMRQILTCANEQKEHFKGYIFIKDEKEERAAIQEQCRELEKAERRIAALDPLFQRLFEEKTTGRISDKRFVPLSTRYEGGKNVKGKAICII